VAEWDKRGDDATPLVLRGLDDEAPIVRQAAVGAVMLGRLGSDDVKRALLRRLEAPGEEPVVQGAALFALQRFALSDAEQTVFLARRRELERRVPR
jgi:HEAT repeat protein